MMSVEFCMPFFDLILGHFNFAMIGVYETECSYDAKTDELQHG